jgi:hypothetical protein
MSIELTDNQLARVLELCAKIAAIRHEMPLAPRGFNVDVEVAKHLRASIEAKNDWLLELSALLR